MEEKKDITEGQSCEIGVGCKPLTPEQARILREGGTELPFSHPLYTEKRAGTYYAADTMEPVFRSEQKYESGTGWPSFWAPVTPDAVTTKTDESHGMTRTEVLTKAGGHLGHVFTDGPDPTGLRYCINGAALVFVADRE
ncbi:MAG: peptide-methionine (R)-S-oxide reductase MsrB [Candidatus Moranbacteria bacterium]|nr:peptide-methionine (R)-S-oxide reductase MsrB [Candidatus Moranbacteria bacterium]